MSLTISSSNGHYKCTLTPSSIRRLSYSLSVSIPLSLLCHSNGHSFCLREMANPSRVILTLMTLCVFSAVAQSPASSPAASPKVAPPRKSATPPPSASSPVTPPSSSTTPPASTPTPTISVSSPPSPTPSPSVTPSSISSPPAEAPTPSENGAVSGNFAVAVSVSVGLFAAFLAM